MQLSKESIKVLDKAKQLARALNHKFAGSEHILISLLSCSKTVKDLLAEVDLDSESLYKLSLAILKETKMAPGEEDEKVQDVTLSPRANRVITVAAAFSTEIGEEQIEPICIFIGILDELSGMCTYLFEQLNINTESLRHIIGEMVGVESEPQKKFKAKPPPTSTPMPPPTMYNQGAGNDGGGGDEEENPLEQFTIDLTRKALEGRLEPVVGRQKELDRIVEVLTRKTKNNPLLIGEPGVGKTAVVEGLASRVITNDIPDSLLHKRILQLDVNALVAGTIYRGQFEERLKKLIDILKASPECILFIDEIHTIMGAGAVSNSMDISNIIKPELARGEISCIGVTTINKYIEAIQPEGAFNRRFQKINIAEPSQDEVFEILKGIRSGYELHHKVKYSNPTLKEIISKCARYLPDKRFPDKAIDVLDELGARERYKLFKEFFFINPKIEEQILDIVSRKDRAQRAGDTELLAALIHEEDEINQELNLTVNAWIKMEKKSVRISKEIVNEYFSHVTKIPVSAIAADENRKLKYLEKDINKQIVGQADAVRALAKTIKRARLSLHSPNRPVGVFLFLGPTGVGKTYSARVLNELLFGTKDSVIQVNMSEMMEEHSVSKMIGAPPGYVGYDTDTSDSFTNKVKENPYSVVLLDEIEKAHPSILQVFLQIFEDGFCKDSKGRRIDFRNTYIIMTSNIGSGIIEKNTTVGFGAALQDDNVETDYKIKKELTKHMAPELINRIDDIIIYHALTKKQLAAVTKLELTELKKTIRKQIKIKLTYSPEVLPWVVEQSYEEKYGARPIKRYINKTLLDGIADAYLNNTTARAVHLEIIDDELKYTCE